MINKFMTMSDDNKKEVNKKDLNVYGIFDHKRGDLIYLGVTRKSVIDSLYLLLIHAFKNNETGFELWLQSLVAQGICPEIVKIESIRGYRKNELEEFWIEYTKFLGLSMVTDHRGGMVNETFIERLKTSAPSNVSILNERSIVKAKVNGIIVHKYRGFEGSRILELNGKESKLSTRVKKIA